MLGDHQTALAPSVLELGGNAPLVIFDDADLDNAIEVIATAGLYNTGQECMAAARLLVKQGQYDEVVNRLARGSPSNASVMALTRALRWVR